MQWLAALYAVSCLWQLWLSDRWFQGNGGWCGGCQVSAAHAQRLMVLITLTTLTMKARHQWVAVWGDIHPCTIHLAKRMGSSTNGADLEYRAQDTMP